MKDMLDCSRAYGKYIKPCLCLVFRVSLSPFACSRMGLRAGLSSCDHSLFLTLKITLNSSPLFCLIKSTGNVSSVITLQKVAHTYIHEHTEFSVMVLLVLPICGQYQLVKMQHRSYPANPRTKHNLTYLFLIQKAENCLFISHTVTFSQSVTPYACCSYYLLTLKAFFFLGSSRRTTKLP